MKELRRRAWQRTAVIIGLAPLLRGPKVGPLQAQTGTGGACFLQQVVRDHTLSGF